MKAAVAPYVGIVVSRDHLDVGIGDNGPGWRAHHDPSAIQLTADRMAEMRPTLVLIECADEAAWPLLSELYAFRIPLVLLDPSRVRDLAKSLRIRTSTGEMDGHFLARLAQAAQLQPMTLPPDTVQRLAAYTVRRRQLEEMLHTETYKRLNTPFARRPMIDERITRLQQELERLSNDLLVDFRTRIAPVLAALANAGNLQPIRRPVRWTRLFRVGATQLPRIRAAILAVLALGTLGLAGVYIRQAFFRPQPPARASRVIDIAGSMNGFDPTEVHVKVGEAITIRLTSVDNPLHTDGGGRHQWAVDELNLNLIAPADGSNMVSFMPERTGSFSFYCDICCGGKGNPAMNGTLVVEG